MNNAGGVRSHGIGRRQFLTGCAGLAAAALLPGGRVFAAASADGLRIQRLAWAGIRLQLPGATLFIDPLVNPDAWGAALKDPLIPVDDAVGNAYVLVTHVHPDHFDAMAVAAALGKGGALLHPAGSNPLPLVPIHYGVTGMEEYVEVEDPIGRLREAARGKPLVIQPMALGEWMDWGQ